MKQQYQQTAIKLVLVLILINAKLSSQGMNVFVHFTNDSILYCKLLSVGELSVAVEWNRQISELWFELETQNLPFDQIQDISFIQTTDETITAGSTVGIIVGGIFGLLVGDALSPRVPTTNIGDFSLPWGAIFGTLVGSTAGGLIGALVSPPTQQVIRLNPNIPQQRDSLKEYIQSR